MLLHQRMQVDEALDVLLKQRSVLEMPDSQFLEPRSLVLAVIRENRTTIVRIDDLADAFYAGERRIVPGQVEELSMLENAGRSFNMARPLEWNVLVRSYPLPARHGEVYGLKIEVVPGILQCLDDLIGPRLEDRLPVRWAV